MIIILTIISIVVAVFQLRQFGMSSNENSGSSQKNPVTVLAMRLCLYPLVQLISRLPITVYQLSYAEPLRNFAFDTSISSAKRFWFYASVVFTPSGGIGNFLAFLLVQPNARTQVACFTSLKMVGDTNTKQNVEPRESWRDSYGDSLYEEEVGEERDMAKPPSFSANTSPRSEMEGGGGGGGGGDNYNNALDLDYAEMDEEELVRQIAHHPQRRQSARPYNTSMKEAAAAAIKGMEDSDVELATTQRNPVILPSE